MYLAKQTRHPYTHVQNCQLWCVLCTRVHVCMCVYVCLHVCLCTLYMYMHNVSECALRVTFLTLYTIGGLAYCVHSSKDIQGGQQPCNQHMLMPPCMGVVPTSTMYLQDNTAGCVHASVCVHVHVHKYVCQEFMRVVRVRNKNGIPCPEPH